MLAAVLANLLNNVPALLVLLPAAAAAGPETVLAVLIGVNAGPNLTYTGSLATLLWRGALRDRGEEPEPRRVPPARRVDRAADPRRRYRRAVARDMRVLAWITEGGWEACVDAVAALDATEVTLLHVATTDLPGPRGRRHEQVHGRMSDLAGEAAEALLDDAAERLGRDAPRSSP